MPLTIFIQWKEAFNTGVEDVDLQHHYFSKLINRLGNELAATDDKQYRAMLLDELVRYTVFHFTSEENIMFRHRYPDLAEHREEHNSLLEKLNRKVNYLTMSRITVQDLTDFLTEWFLQHTIKLDQQFGQYVEDEGLIR